MTVTQSRSENVAWMRQSIDYSSRATHVESVNLFLVAMLPPCGVPVRARRVHVVVINA